MCYYTCVHVQCIWLAGIHFFNKLLIRQNNYGNKNNYHTWHTQNNKQTISEKERKKKRNKKKTKVGKNIVSKQAIIYFSYSKKI